MATPTTPNAPPATPPPVAPPPATPDISHTQPFATETVNVVKLQEITKRDPKQCGSQEVAPGVWVRLECHHYVEVKRSATNASARKLRAIQAHRTYIHQRNFTEIARLIGGMGKAPLQGGFTKKGQAPPAPPAPPPGGGTTPPAAPPPGGGELAGAAPVGDPVRMEGDPMPAEVDHRKNSTEGPVKYQGAVGACTAFSLSSAIDNSLRRAGKQDVSSPSHVWSNYGVPQMGVAGDENLGKSIASIKTWDVKHSELCKLMQPNIWGDDCESAYGVKLGSAKSDPGIQEKIKASNANAPFKIEKIKRLKSQPADMDELTTALASGASLWIAMKIAGGAWNNKAMKNYVMPDWTAPSGGHAIVMSGYRNTPTGRQFLIHNSWGESWGEKGYAWVSQKMVDQFMHYAYKVEIAGEPAPSTPGKTKPAVLFLTDDDCDADELIDPGTGLCGQICDDDSRRFNNQCGTLPNIFGKK